MIIEQLTENYDIFLPSELLYRQNMDKIVNWIPDEHDCVCRYCCTDNYSEESSVDNKKYRVCFTCAIELFEKDFITVFIRDLLIKKANIPD